MRRILMISDVHGCIDQFNELLDIINYNPHEDKLVLLGDYVDKGPQSKEAVDKVIRLVKDTGAVALRGNHDQRFVDVIRSNDTEIHHKFIEHGGLQTIQSYCDFVDESTFNEDQYKEARQYIGDHFGEHIDFLATLPLYHEDEHHVYVHAGLNPQYSNWREQPEHDFMYIKGEFHRSKPKTEKVVIFGHTRTTALHGSPDVWFGQGKIGIDGGCSDGFQLNGLMYENGGYSTKHVKMDR